MRILARALILLIASFLTTAGHAQIMGGQSVMSMGGHPAMMSGGFHNRLGGLHNQIGGFNRFDGFHNRFHHNQFFFAFENRRFFPHRRFFDRDLDDRFFSRDRLLFRDRFPFGFGAFGFGGFGFGDPPLTAAARAAVDPDPPTLSRSTQVVDLPSCHETTESGVAIFRGKGCARNRP
jgi:hypothetical protein